MENESLYLLIGIITLLIILNSVASYIILNTYFEMKERRMYQMLFVWFLPFIGAVFAILINREDYFADRRLKKVGNNSDISQSQAVNMAQSVGNHSER